MSTITTASKAEPSIAPNASIVRPDKPESKPEVKPLLPPTLA
jgi:hypothetical protein